MSHLRVLRRVFLVVVLGVAFAGCAKDEGGSVVPVKGKVTVGGAAVTSGQVSYLPVSTDQKGGNSSGTIDSNGEYTISTAGKAGVPPGKYKVTVTPSMVPQKDASKMPTTAFNTKYTRQDTTPLTIDVPSSSGYDLKLDK